MKTSVKLIAILFVLAACSRQEKPDEIFIGGFVKVVPDGKVYLTHAHDPKEILDSTEVENGHFKFVLKFDASFVPFLASIHYRDSTFTENNMIRRIAFLNTYQSNAGTSAFFQGIENTMIKENLDIPEDPRIPTFHHITGGKDQVLYQKFMNKGFGSLDNIDSAKRLARLNYIKKTVEQHPDSYFLLSQIYQNKEAYTQEELNSLLSLFDKDVRDSSTGKKFYSYLTNRPSPNKPYPNLLLTNAMNEEQRILRPNARMNLLVFWASWCGPCRQEIPALKKINHTFKDKGLNMVSISIDRDSSSWQKALGQEKMDWQQYIVGKEQMESVQQQFNFSAIPFVVLTDNSGIEVLKVLGYNKNNIKEINAAIRKNLAGK
ncbi:AhpC/TSA family protein [Pontibacter pamirensis]|uniref:AhpC/TSA family protein n=1 Tax=Pontibacter pamirensis TaxID=2562824 RepID=UPI001389908E|nr:AhpC/TSA family protein [Pontibacter pamirensis]